MQTLAVHVSIRAAATVTYTAYAQCECQTETRDTNDSVECCAGLFATSRRKRASSQGVENRTLVSHAR